MIESVRTRIYYKPDNEENVWGYSYFEFENPFIKSEEGLMNSKSLVAVGLDQVNHPSHYGGESNPYEAIKVIEAWQLGFNIGNVVKYLSRAGKKDPSKEITDLEKAKWYLEREIDNLKKKGLETSTGDLFNQK